MSDTPETTAPLAVVHYDGETYDIPGAEDWPVEALLAYEDGRMGNLVRSLLGEDGWARFTAKAPKVRDISALFEQIDAAVKSGN